MKKNKAAQSLGKLSVEARRKKFKIKNWSEHMKKVRNGKQILVKPVEVKNFDKRLFKGSNDKKGIKD